MTKSYISNDVLVDIFLKLPMKVLLRCKSVCKLWLKIIEDPHFAYLRLEKDKKGSVSDRFLIECYATSDWQGKNFNYEFRLLDDEDIYHTVWKPEIQNQSCHVSVNREEVPIVGSCNGLICIERDNGFQICNLLYSNDIYKLPFPSKANNASTHYGFGFDESIKRFKIVILFNCFVSVESSHHNHAPLIHEFGSSTSSASWRQLSSEKAIPCIQFYDGISVLLHGELHWLAQVNHGIDLEVISFNLSKDEFVVIPIPVVVKKRLDLDVNNSMLLDLEGGLGLAEVFRNESIKFWALVKDNNEDNSKKKNNWIVKFHVECIDLRIWEISNVCFWKPNHILFKMDDHDYLYYNAITCSTYDLPELGRNCILYHQGSLIRSSSLKDVPSYIY